MEIIYGNKNPGAIVNTPEKNSALHFKIRVFFCRILSTVVKTTVGFPLCTELIKANFRVCLLGGDPGR